MLSKFFPSLKPKEYSVQVLRDSTSQSAVKRIKRNRTKAPYKKIAALALALSFIGGGLVSATAATAVTSKQAQANIISDSICLRNDADNSGAWNGGGNVYGVIGGRAQFGMAKVTKDSVPNDAARNGKAGGWRDTAFDTNGSASQRAYADGEFLTAYEKYGINYPIYDAWRPVTTDGGKDATIKQVDTSRGSYDVGGKLPTKGTGNTIQIGSSSLVTSDMGACLALMPTVSAAVSNAFSVLPRLAMYISIELYTTAYGSSLSSPDSVLYGLGQNIDKFITAPGGLKDVLFVAFMIPLILIGALYVAYVGIIKRGVTQALQSTGWMVLTIALGSVFLAQPTLISNFVDSGVSEVQSIVNQAVTSGSKSNEMCALPPGSYKESVRETRCTLWHSTIYSTWAAGQFGESAGSAAGQGTYMTQEAGGRNILGEGGYTIVYGSKNGQQAESWPQFMVDRQATTKSLELSEVAYAQLSGDGVPVNNAWAGSVDMLSSSILMFFGAGASSAVLFVYGFSLLIYQLMMISAVLMSPFFFLFGIVPNWGRRVLMRYAELLTSLFVKRVMTATLLSFYLLFYNLIIGGAEANALIIKLLLGAVLAVFFIGQRGRFIKMFADNINFGGNKSIGLPGNKAVAATAGLTAGLIGGGLIGGAIVGHKARKENKDTEHSMKDMKIEGSPTADVKSLPKGDKSKGGSGVAQTATRTATNVGTKMVTNKIKDTLSDSVADRASDAVTNAAQNAAKARGNATPRMNPTGSSTGTPAPPTMPMSPAGGGASSSAGAASSAGGAGATVAPGISAAGAASGASATGAAAAGSAGISAAGAAGVAAGGAAGGAAAAGGVAAGGGAVAAGAAAGSVVPVVGTIAGAAAGAAIVAVANKKKADAEKSNGDQ
jgi:hypothetical protein